MCARVAQCCSLEPRYALLLLFYSLSLTPNSNVKTIFPPLTEKAKVAMAKSALGKKWLQADEGKKPSLSYGEKRPVNP